MADDRVTAKLAAIQFHDPTVALDEELVSSHGKFVYSLQVVVENVAGWNEIRDEVLTDSRDMIVRAAISCQPPIEMSPSGAGVGRSGGERKRTVAEPNPRAE